MDQLTIDANESYIPPNIWFKAVTAADGPTINVVLVSAMAYIDVFKIVDPTVTLLKEKKFKSDSTKLIWKDFTYPFEFPNILE